MADQKQSQEFLGGGPKFNSVGKDTRGLDGTEEPIVPVVQTAYWLRVAVVVVILIALAGTLFYLNDRSLGKTNVQTSVGGHPISPDAHPEPTDSNLK